MITSETEARSADWWHRVDPVKEFQRNLWVARLTSVRVPQAVDEQPAETTPEVEYL